MACAAHSGWGTVSAGPPPGSHLGGAAAGSLHPPGQALRSPALSCGSVGSPPGADQKGSSAATLALTGERGASAGTPQPAGPAAGAPGRNPPGRQQAGPAVAQGLACREGGW